jgi:hypothetical protein
MDFLRETSETNTLRKHFVASAVKGSNHKLEVIHNYFGE